MLHLYLFFLGLFPGYFLLREFRRGFIVLIAGRRLSLRLPVLLLTLVGGGIFFWQGAATAFVGEVAWQLPVALLLGLIAPMVGALLWQLTIRLFAVALLMMPSSSKRMRAKPRTPRSAPAGSDEEMPTLMSGFIDRLLDERQRR